jgi:aldehyde:ferredoxin oxidoreductase
MRRLPRDFVPPSPVIGSILEMFEAVTGRRISLEEALSVGERILNLQRCFNIRHGLTPEHDDVSERLLSSPVGGPAKGISSRPYLKGMVEEYYRLMGWDAKTGKPLRGTLRRLGLEKEIADMWGNAEAPRDREEIDS